MNGPPHNDPKRNDAVVSVAARWVVPVDGPPVEHGVIDVENGRIVAIHQDKGEHTLTFEDGVVIPGLVNAHTHLEFSSLATPLRAGSFSSWIRAIVSHRRERTISNSDASARGVLECAESGTTTVGEIATEGWSRELLAGTDLRTVAFRELIALDPDRIASQLEIAASHLDLTSAADSAGVIAGLSPHAPYSVHPELFREICGLAAGRKAPVAFHLAETREELELLERARGPLVELFREMGFWIDGQIPLRRRPLDYLLELSVVPRGLVIHGNYLANDEIDWLADHPNLSVVYCPRTHSVFGHSPHPWRRMQERGVRVALGTDSRASNPDLSLWSEVLFLRERYPDVEPALLLQMATLNGAIGLGLEEVTGSLTPGKAADLAVIQPAQGDFADSFAGLMSPGSRVLAAMCGGRWTFGRRVTR